MWTRIYALIKKEMITFLRDPKTRVVLIVPPLIQLIIFANAATLDVKNVPIGILNRDNGEQAIELLQRFHGSPVFNHIIYLKSETEIAPFIDNQRGVMVVSIDEQFSRNLDAQKNAIVQLIMDGRKSNTAQVVFGYASGIIDQFNRDFAQRVEYDLQRADTIPRYWFNPNLIYQWFIVPSLCGILTMLVALTVTGLSVAREKELGTFDQLLVSPLLPIEIMIGKAVPAIIFSAFEGTAILVLGMLIYQVPFVGSFPLLYAALFVFICSIVGFGLFISSLVHNQQQAVLGAFVFMSPSVLLSGFATPIENMPDWLQPVTYLNPLRYMLVILRGIFLKDIPAAIVWSNTWPLILIATATLSGATWFFRKRLE